MTKIEQVARAMSVKDKGADQWDVMSEDGDGYGYVGKNEYLAMARAAIEAMREPTAEMRRVADSYSDEVGYEFLYGAMIDAALAEK